MPNEQDKAENQRVNHIQNQLCDRKERQYADIYRIHHISERQYSPSYTVEQLKQRGYVRAFVSEMTTERHGVNHE